jgi:cell division protein ZapA (FtsZ GTPase activity inhibitor)
MKKTRWDKGLIAMLISTLITVVVWVGVEVYRAYFRVSTPEGIEKHLTEIDTSLDTTVFDKLRARGAK